jgi:hypothetical protein
VKIRLEGKMHDLGSFATERRAAIEYDEGARRYLGRAAHGSRGSRGGPVPTPCNADVHVHIDIVGGPII